MKPIAWMFQHSETGNVAFVDSPEQAEKFGKENPRWIVIPLCAAPLAQPEQECIYPECETSIGCDGPCGEKPVDETAKHRHEPGLWVVQYKDRHEFVWGAKPVFRGDTVLGLKPLYTAPPKREWVGLTDEEIDKTEWEPSYGNPMTLAEGLQLFARTIEAKLKEKNT